MKTTDDINLSDIFELVKEWQGLERDARDLEFRRIAYARKVRQRFAPGNNGDRQFKDFCIVHLKMKQDAAAIMLTMAIAGGVFGDALELKATGGERALALISTADPAEQESMMRTAKAQAFTIATIWNRRNANKQPTRRTPAWDAQRMAEYLAKHVKPLPKPLREIVARYVRIDEKARA